jgi:siroheme synthase-like protein
MSLFPIFVKLKGRLVVVIGGGKIAEEKIPGWVRFGKIEWRPKEFEPEDLQGAFLVIAATSALEVNESVFREAEARGILCNAVDDIKNCHFYYGSIVQRGDLQIAISTNGKSPALAQRLRKELEAQFAPEYEAWVQWLGAARDALRASGADSEPTKKLLHELAGQPMFEEFLRRAGQQPRRRGAA